MQKGYIHVLTACASIHVNVIKLGPDAFLSLQFMIIFHAAISSGIVVWCGADTTHIRYYVQALIFLLEFNICVCVKCGVQNFIILCSHIHIAHSQNFIISPPTYI